MLNITVERIASELSSLTGDRYDDVAAGLLQCPPRNRLVKARQLLADARDRQHRIDRPRHYPPCGRCMRCQRGIPCERRIHRDDNSPHISAHDKAVHEQRRRWEDDAKDPD